MDLSAVLRELSVLEKLLRLASEYTPLLSELVVEGEGGRTSWGTGQSRSAVELECVSRFVLTTKPDE